MKVFIVAEVVMVHLCVHPRTSTPGLLKQATPASPPFDRLRAGFDRLRAGFDRLRVNGGI
ncbi:MAG: hypothetical protein WAP08_04750 [Smithellaceae bacterium]|nr:hypothetical protein [Syntrophaceae bacterium]